MCCRIVKVAWQYNYALIWFWWFLFRNHFGTVCGNEQDHQKFAHFSPVDCRPPTLSPLNYCFACSIWVLEQKNYLAIGFATKRHLCTVDTFFRTSRGKKQQCIIWLTSSRETMTQKTFLVNNWECMQFCETTAIMKPGMVKRCAILH